MMQIVQKSNLEKISGCVRAHMVHIFFVLNVSIDAIERKSFLLRLARRIFRKIGTQGFFGSLNTNLHSKFGNRKIRTRGFSKSLITNPNSTFRNSKYRMQYGASKCKKKKVMPQRVLCGEYFSDERSCVRRFI